MRSPTLFLILTGFLLSCASAPEFDTTQVDLALTPQKAIAEPSLSHGKMALWGGTILNIRNLKDSTQIEVLGYPLSSYHRPIQKQKSFGRFIILHDGFIEPSIYSQDKLITVLGSVSDSKTSKVGDSQYNYAVIVAQKIHLWPQNDEKIKTHFQIGIGIQM